MATNHQALRTQLKECKDQLLQKGWEHILSKMSDSPKGQEYGLLFTRNGARYWLNIETMHHLPE